MHTSFKKRGREAMYDQKIYGKKIKKDFPIFSHHKNLIYFDNATTYQKPRQVIDAVSNFYKTANSNVHRSFYKLGEVATEQYEGTREKLRKFINAKDVSEIIFTKGTTESINFIANSWARDHLKPGDEIVTSKAEHHANFIPWQKVAQKTGATLKFINFNKQTGYLEDAEKLINKKTKLVAVTQASNVVGDVWEVGHLEKLIEKAHSVGAKVLLDSAQAIIHHKIDVQKLNPDFIAFSGHKMMAPTGIGVAYIKQELHGDVSPNQFGGSMIGDVSFEKAVCALPPKKFEAGTPPISSVIGWGSALDYIEKKVNFDELGKHEASLCNKALDGLCFIKGINIAGNIDNLRKHGYVISFTIDGIDSEKLANKLGAQEIAFRTGHHCAIPFVRHLGSDDFLRISLGMYNSQKDIETFLDGLQRSVATLRTRSIRSGLSA